MTLGSKTIIKALAVVGTVFQGYALHNGHDFSPMAYFGGIAGIFGTNSAHEHVQKWLTQRKDITE